MGWQPGLTLDDIEKQVIQQALRFYQNHQGQTAGSLGIGVRTLYNKMVKYGIRTGPRIPLESTAETSTQFTVPLQEREEIQAVSPGENGSGHSNPNPD